MNILKFTKPATIMMTCAAFAWHDVGAVLAGPGIVDEPDVGGFVDTFSGFDGSFVPSGDVFSTESGPLSASGNTGAGAAQAAGTASIAPPAGVTLSSANAAATQFISFEISDSYAICSLLPEQEYAVDCLGERMEELVKALPDTGDYANAKAVLQDTSRKLRSLAQSNKSTTKRPARIKTTVRNKKITSGTLTPVKTEAIKPAMVQAVAILDEASTVLLRSSGNSERRKVSYQKIAAAIGSNKRLLRSA